MNVTYRRAVQAHVASALDDTDVAELRRILDILAHRLSGSIGHRRGP